MYNPDAPIITVEDIEKATSTVTQCPEYVRTPMLQNMQQFYDVDQTIKLCMKLENMQTTGSFKLRGVLNQFSCLPSDVGTTEKKIISLSAGNYGRTFAYLTNKLGKKGVIVMPDTAPKNREEVIRKYGVDVHRSPSSTIMDKVNELIESQNMMLLHSFDDHRLVAGYGSLGKEILEDCPDADIVLVCCGGGGLVSGVAAAIKLHGNKDCRIYGVEPEGARTMHESFRTGKPATMDISSIASGLAPPYAGPNTYRHCRKFVDDILLVSDKEIITAMYTLIGRGLLVEPSGAAAFSALLHGKVPDVQGKKVVVVITGGNVTPEELVDYKKYK